MAAFQLKEEILSDDSVKIFILDSEVDKDFLNSPALKIQAESSHGSKIAAVIRSQSRADIRAFSAENIINKIDRENYLASLKKIRNYALAHPEEKIIVNISLGFREQDFQKEIIENINELENIILIAAAGNNNSEEISYPAKFKGVVAVAALEGSKKMAASNYGREIDFSASGIIEITQRHHLPALDFSRKYKLSGTSFAAPQLTALIADILSLNSRLKIKDALKIAADTARTFDEPLFAEGKLGAGKIDRFRALSRANKLYFWLQLTLYLSLGTAALILLAICWRKYSLSGLFIYLIILSLGYLSQPFLLLLYYQFGLIKISLSLSSLALIYLLFLKLSSFYIKQSSSLKLMLKLGPYLNQKLRKLAAERIIHLLQQKSIINEDQIKLINNYLLKSNSKKKTLFYLKISSQLKKPPIKKIIEKSLNYHIKADCISANLNQAERNIEERAVLNTEILAVIIKASYQQKKKAAETAAELRDPLLLVPIKNILKKEDYFEIDYLSLYFLLDILEAFGDEAQDFTELLKELILKENNPWLKYHALKAYQKIALKDSDYQKFIAEIMAKEKEPVTLALENDFEF